MDKIFSFIARLIKRAPWWIAAVILLSVVGTIPGIIVLKTDSGLNTLVSSGSQLLKDTHTYQTQFGGEPITILLRGQLADIFSTANLQKLEQFELEMSQAQACRSIYSPLTVINQAIDETNAGIISFQENLKKDQEEASRSATREAVARGLSPSEQEMAAQSARDRVLQEYQQSIEHFQKTGNPSLDNPAFISSVLYNPDGSASPFLASLVPDDQHALIVITPRGNQSDSSSLDTLNIIKNGLSKYELDNVSTSVISDTSIIAAISSRLKSDMLLLLGLAVLVMMAILFVLFRVRWRLLSLLMVGVGTLWTFGVMGFLSVPLSMATMAILPILIGLGIDYPIQFHNRYHEELARKLTANEALVTTISRMAPAVGVALIATIIGFTTLFISDIPMIRDFGTILAMGVVLCFLVALFLLSSILYLRYSSSRRKPSARGNPSHAPIVNSSLPGEKDNMSGTSVVTDSPDQGPTGGKLQSSSTQNIGWIERIPRLMSSAAIKKPALVISIAVALGVAGGVVDHWLPAITDYEQLIPQDVPELIEMRELRELMGAGGRLHLLIQADDLTQPEILSQIKTYQDEEMAKYPEIISANGWVTTIYQASEGTITDQYQVQSLLDALPEQMKQQVISNDRKMASISFGMLPLSLDRVDKIIDGVRNSGQNLAGVSIVPAGSLALGAGTIESVLGNRLMMNILCLSAIFVILLVIYRRLFRAIFIILPVALVIGWSSLLMFISGIPLNPLTAVLGVITTSIGIEFMVLMASRYEEEKAKGEHPRDAMTTAASKMGRAIVVTGVTTLGGFGVLIASDFVMIRDFGLITLAGLALCILSAIMVMPPLMVWFDERKRRLAEGT